MTSAFTTQNVSALEAVGRVSNKGRKPSLTLSIDNDAVLHCVSDGGFSLSLNVGNYIAEGEIHHVRCILDNRLEISCSGSIDPSSGSLRLDADDQNAFSWFWFAVQPNYRGVLMSRGQ